MTILAKQTYPNERFLFNPDVEFSMTQGNEFSFVVKKSGFNGVMNLHSYLFTQIFAYETHFEEAIDILRGYVENVDEKTIKTVFDNFLMLEIIQKV